MDEKKHSFRGAINASLMNAAFLDALQKSWSNETCWDGCKPGYNGKNPALGQCLITTLVAWALRDYQDEIIASLVYEPNTPPDKAIWHFYLNGPIDLTRQQFKPGSKIEEVRYNHPRHHDLIYYSVFDEQEQKSLQSRLDLLLKKLRENGFTTKHTAAEIINKLKKHYAYAHPNPHEQKEGITMPLP